jgi:membrane-bound serine protease (ClpP class)
MDWWIIFAVLLYLVSAALIVAEVFIPSGGIISIFAFISMVGGVAIFFQYSTFIGVMGIIIALIMIPTVLIIAYKIFPKTSFGNSVTLTPPNRQQGDAIPDTDKIKELLGRTAMVISPLRPVGMCDFDGQRVECVAESGYIEENEKVKVIKVEGTQLTVRITEQS